jgi:putative transposase
MGHHRRSIRLKGFDYSQNGYYFVTICVQNREWLLGNSGNGEMTLSEAGMMVKKRWFKLPVKYSNIRLDEFIIMPNHIHGIIIIDVGPNPCLAGRQACIRPNKNINIKNIQGDNVVSPLPSSNIPNSYSGLGQYISWFKRMSTNAYIHGVKEHDWPMFNKHLWQRNYYEHIIWNEKQYCAIKQYIQDNVKNWEMDELFT